MGVEDPLRGPALLEVAKHEAERRGARLLVVVGEADATYEPSDVFDLGETEVEVDVVVRGGLAAQVILEHSAHSALVIAGRHHRRQLIGASLGRTVRKLLRHSSIPVMIVDPVRGDRTGPQSTTTPVATEPQC